MSDSLLPYEELFEKELLPTAQALQQYLLDILEDEQRVDIVSARAKSPSRFAAKAAKCDLDGVPKYTNPRYQIQDQIGARINVFYLADVDRISNVIEEYFPSIETARKEPDNDAEFGYFGRHFILALPDDVTPEETDPTFPKFFELQIKTLFQHAWSEAHHDLGYKSVRELSASERREVAFSSAQSWGADQVFDALARKLVEGYSSSPLNEEEQEA